MPRLETLRKRYVIKGILRAITPLHIGRGRGEPELGEADLPILKLADGRPYIPGSSIKGCIRAEAERILTGLGIHVCIYEKSAANIAPDYRCGPEKPCASCEIFGSTEMSSRVIIRDALPLQKTPAEVRTGIALERDTRTVAPGRLFEIEYVPPGVEFELEIVVENPEPWMLGLLFLVLRSLSVLGGQGSRGMGKVEFRLERIEVWTPNSIIEQRAEEVYEDDKLEEFIETCKRTFKESIGELKERYGGLT